MNIFVGVLLGLIISMNAHATIYDLVRTIQNGDDGITYDSATHAYFISTGTLEIVDNNMTRNFHICKFDICKDLVFNDKLMFVDTKGSSAAVSDVNGNIYLVYILSLNPTIMILTESNELKTFQIDEYKLRQ